MEGIPTYKFFLLLLRGHVKRKSRGNSGQEGRIGESGGAIAGRRQLPPLLRWERLAAGGLPGGIGDQTVPKILPALTKPFPKFAKLIQRGHFLAQLSPQARPQATCTASRRSLIRCPSNGSGRGQKDPRSIFSHANIFPR